MKYISLLIVTASMTWLCSCTVSYSHHMAAVQSYHHSVEPDSRPEILARVVGAEGCKVRKPLALGVSDPLVLSYNSYCVSVAEDPATEAQALHWSTGRNHLALECGVTISSAAGALAWCVATSTFPFLHSGDIVELVHLDKRIALWLTDGEYRRLNEFVDEPSVYDTPVDGVYIVERSVGIFNEGALEAVLRVSECIGPTGVGSTTLHKYNALEDTEKVFMPPPHQSVEKAIESLRSYGIKVQEVEEQ